MTRGRRTNTAVVPDPDGSTNAAEVLAGVICRPANGVTAHAVRASLRGPAAVEPLEEAVRTASRLDQLARQSTPARRLRR